MDSAGVIALCIQAASRDMGLPIPSHGEASHIIGLGLRDVESANNWRDARERLQELHRTVSYELPIIPLWQIVDSFAYRRELTGVGRDIVSLYQNVERWRLNLQ